jgi:hydroxyacid-oxoacid transhydrogenase
LSIELESVIPFMMTRLKFGAGATEELGYELAALGAKSVLLVADRNLAQHGLIDRARAIVENEGIRVSLYDEVSIEPTDAALRHAIASVEGSDHDAFVALGGGSTIDTAKAMNLYSTHPADLYD